MGKGWTLDKEGTTCEMWRRTSGWIGNVRNQKEENKEEGEVEEEGEEEKEEEDRGDGLGMPPARRP